MPDDNLKNLPILDDIIRPGDTDKDAPLPSDRLQAEEPAPEVDPVADQQIDSVDVLTDEPATEEAYFADVQMQHQEPVEAAEAPQDSPSMPDTDALTEEILFGILPELEQMLRDRIQQTLIRHIKDVNEPDQS